MRIEPESRYSEDRAARRDFNYDEMEKMRVLLRRIRYLEKQANERKDQPSTPASVWAEREVEALEFVLTDMGYLRKATT